MERTTHTSAGSAKALRAVSRELALVGVGESPHKKLGSLPWHRRAAVNGNVLLAVARAPSICFLASLMPSSFPSAVVVPSSHASHLLAFPVLRVPVLTPTCLPYLWAHLGTMCTCFLPCAKRPLRPPPCPILIPCSGFATFPPSSLCF